MTLRDILSRIIAAYECLECGDADTAAAYLRDLEDDILEELVRE